MNTRQKSAGLVFCLSLVGPTSEALQAQTAESLVALHIEARGGAERLEAIHTLSMSGRATLGPGREALVTRVVKPPGRIRTEFFFQGVTAVFACDGSRCWYADPMSGIFDAEPMSASETTLAMEEADVFGSIDWKAKGDRVELMGRETIDGNETYELKVISSVGPARTVFLNLESALVVRRETTRSFGARAVDVQTNYSRFEEVEGVVFPHSIRIGAKDQDEFLDLIVEKIEINLPIDDARFEMPTAGPVE